MGAAAGKCGRVRLMDPEEKNSVVVCVCVCMGDSVRVPLLSVGLIC